MAKQHVTDAEFIAALTTDDERALGALTSRLIGSVTAYLTQMGATKDEAKEIFYIGLTALWRKGRRGYPPGFNFYAYLLQTCKQQWYNEIDRKKRGGGDITFDEAGVLQDRDPSIQEILEQVEFEEQLYRYLDRLGEPCRTLLLLWADGLSFEEIAQQMGYQNTNSARQQKHRCLDRLRDIMNDET